MVRRFIKKADKNTTNEIERLLDGGSILKPVKEELTYAELDDSINHLWSVLYATGYLTGRDSGKEEEERMELAIPTGRSGSFLPIWKGLVSGNGSCGQLQDQQVCAAFPAGDVSTIQNMLHDYLGIPSACAIRR